MEVPFKVRANYGWAGQAKGDLGFLEGDILGVTRIAGDWLYGYLLRNRKCQGYFPKNFVSVVGERRTVESGGGGGGSVSGKVPEVPRRTGGDGGGRRQRESRAGTPALPPLPSLLVKSQSLGNMEVSRSGTRNLGHHSGSFDKVLETHDSGYYARHQGFYDGYSPGSSGRLHATASSSDLFSNSQYVDYSDSLNNSENSFAIMSDFSATSAGSFARHRYAQSFSESQSGDEPLQLSFDKKNNNSSNNAAVWNATRKKTGFAKLMDLPKLPDLAVLQSNNNDTEDWLTVKSHVNRSRTLTKYEKHPRYMRALEENRDLILHPQDSIYSGLNTNETIKNARQGLIDIHLQNLNMDYLTELTHKRCRKRIALEINSWSKMTFSSCYSTPLEQLFGIYIFCTEMFELIDDNGNTDFSKEVDNVHYLIKSKYVTPYQLTWIFKKIANALGVTCEIVIGFLKTPSANNTEFAYNHCWLQVLVNNEWRFIDVILGNLTNPIHEFINNCKRTKSELFYFMSEPLNFIYTHIPPRDFEQHIVPSIDQLSALYLPLVFPSFFSNDVKLYKYSTALSYMEDSEIFECSLQVPNDIELFASVITAKSSRNSNLALSQVKKQRRGTNDKIVIIKAVLPKNVSKGHLYIHSGLRGSENSRKFNHPLSIIIPLFHRGDSTDFEFVLKHPPETLMKVENYIVEPQNKYLFQNNEYLFQIVQSPYDGIIYNKNAMVKSKEQPIVIRSPSGKKYELEKKDSTSPYGTWQRTIKVREPGIWKSFVQTETGTGWIRFAEWSAA